MPNPHTPWCGSKSEARRQKAPLHLVNSGCFPLRPSPKPTLSLQLAFTQSLCHWNVKAPGVIAQAIGFRVIPGRCGQSQTSGLRVRAQLLGPPVVTLYRFFFGWEGCPTKIIDYRQKIGYPYSHLSAGGASFFQARHNPHGHRQRWFWGSVWCFPF